MAKLKGTELSLYGDSLVVAYAKSFEYSLKANLVDTTTMADGQWSSKIQTGLDFEGSVDSFMMRPADTSRGFNYLQNCMVNNASIGVKFQYDPSVYMLGAAFISDLKVSNSGPREMVTYSASLTGTGAFTFVG